jgi:uncharacterized protein (TIGR03067 family)
VATSLVLSTVKTATTVSAGGAVASAGSAKVAALVKGGLNAMTFATLKIGIALCVGVGVLGAGVVGLARQQSGAPEALSAPDELSAPPGAAPEKPQTPEEQKAAKAKFAEQQEQEAARKALAAQPGQEAQKGKPGTSDEDSLRGAWTAVSGETGGREFPAEAVKGYRLTFADGNVTVQFAGETKQGKFKVDPAARPRTMDLDLDGGAGVGIYSLEGDTLKLCFTESGKEDRPGKFSTDEKSRCVLLVFKRGADVKKESGAKQAGEKEGAGDRGDLPQVAALKQMLRAVETERDLLKAEFKRAREELDGVLTKVDAEKKTVSFSLKGTKLTLEAVPLAGDARFLTGDRAVTINDLKKGMEVSLQVRTEGERTVVTAIKAAPKTSDK